jgi:hypothetical protein
VIHRRRPERAPAVWRGTAYRNSFRTPEREVIVEEPVKFMARKAEREGRASSQTALSHALEGKAPGSASEIRAVNSTAQRSPVRAPLSEKARPGSHGSRRGAAIAPAATVPRKAAVRFRPLAQSDPRE